MSNSQLNKLKSGIQNNSEVTLKIWSNVVGDSNNENNFLQFSSSKFRKTFANNSSADIKTQLHKIGESRRFLGRPLGPILKTGLRLIENLLKPLAKNILIPLGLTAVT